MKKDLGKVIIVIVAILGLGFGFFSLNQYKREKEEKFRIEKIRLENEAEKRAEKQSKLADSIHKEEVKRMDLMMNACSFCNKQMEDIYYMDEIGLIYTDRTEVTGNYKEFCSSKCGEDYLAKDKAEYYKANTNESSNIEPSSNSNSSYSSNNTCSWCGKSFSGEHYTHLGKMSDCYSTSSSSSIGKYCSIKCCSEARKSSCPKCH